MTKIAILGANGMLGHRLLTHLADRHEIIGTARKINDRLSSLAARARVRVLEGLTAEDHPAFERMLDAERPDVVVNCIGVVKQLSEAKDPLVAIPINALFPHWLARTCAKRGVRMLHFSTDCVFSGEHGPYTEDSAADARDLYGRSKLLGEVDEPNALTLRTSIIGHEINVATGLVEWILRNKGGQVSGFARALYTGVTTDYMAEAVGRLIEEFPDLSGIWHLSADTISKFDLVRLVNRVYMLNIRVDRDEAFICDRRLDSSRLRERTGIVPPSWDAMIDAMHRAYTQEQETVDRT